MSYQRVLPRDLFNEAKLLKCLGQLALLIHDNKCGKLCMELDDSEREGFKIGQALGDGTLYCENIECRLGDEMVAVGAPYNSKQPYPLTFLTADHDGPVFNDDGSLSEEFQALLFGEKI